MAGTNIGQQTSFTDIEDTDQSLIRRPAQSSGKKTRKITFAVIKSTLLAYFNGVYATLSALATEVTNRTNADTALSNALNTESSARVNGDAAAIQRANHTGVQAISTVTNLQSTLDAKADLVGGLVPSNQLPSFVDDVIEAANFAALPGSGVTGKIYVTLDTNITYRWSGSAYVIISDSLALGETFGSAYRGDRGKTAFDHSQISGSNPHGTTAAQIIQDSNNLFHTDAQAAGWSGKQDNVGLIYTSITIPAVAVGTMNSLPPVIVATPPVGKAIRILDVIGHLKYQTTPWDTSGGSSNIYILPEGGDYIGQYQWKLLRMVDKNVEVIRPGVIDFADVNDNASSLIANTAIVAMMDVDPTGGDSEIVIHILYKIIDL